MKELQPCKLHLPDFWASSIINNDNSGLEEKEIEKLNDFIEYWSEDIYIERADIPSDENGCIETHFMKYHDATNLGVLACDCCEYTFQINPKSSLYETN